MKERKWNLSASPGVGILCVDSVLDVYLLLLSFLISGLDLQDGKVCPQISLLPPKYVEFCSDWSMSTLASIAAS